MGSAFCCVRRKILFWVVVMQQCSLFCTLIIYNDKTVYKMGGKGMRTIFLGLMMAVVVLTGCGINAKGRDDALQTKADDVTARQEETSMETETSTEAETKGNVQVEFSYDNIYMAVELPAGWEYEIKELDEKQEGETCGIIFGPTEQKELRYELFYHSFYGICATGVTIEELQLENGTDIWRYSEVIENTLWRNIVFEYEKPEDEKGSYVLQYYADEKLAEKYEEELRGILETIVVGR